MRITIVGPGALGLLWAGRLARAGAEVALLDHRPDRAEAISQNGIILEDDQGYQTFSLPASANPARLAGTDLALVCVKAYDTAIVARALAQGLGPKAKVLTIQNGAGNVEALAAALGPERVLGGITSEGATLLEPGHVRHAGAGHTAIGPAAGAIDGDLLALAQLFSQAGFETKAAEGVQNLIWTKLVINVGINALTAILDVDNGQVAQVEPVRSTLAAAVEEALAVGRRLGVEFLNADMLAATLEVAQRTAKNVSSMRQDVRSRRRTEVEFINGHVCRQGQDLGLPTPVNQTLTNLVLGLEAGYLPQ